MADPNADLIGYAWFTPGSMGLIASEVEGTHELLPSYVVVKETMPGGGEYRTIRPTAVVRRHKELTKGVAREDPTSTSD